MDINWAQILLNSVITGSIYLIGAIGLSVTYRLSNFSNFAHAEFITLGAFIGYWVSSQLGWGLLPAFIIAFLLTGTVSLLCYRGIFQPLAKRGASTIHLMIASIAVGFIIRYSIGAGWGWTPQYFLNTWTTYEVGAIRITGLWLLLILVTLTSALTMHFALMRTKLGKAIRASSSNPELAAASGINVNRVILITWFIGAGLAAIAGIFRGASTQVWPMTGWDIILPIFAVVVLGGIGNYHGAIVAAFIIGLTENIGVVALTNLGLATEYRMALAFLIIIITLIVKPQGLAMFFRRA
ncbi:MAG: branched-chain amino acid ABC transporter permease [Dehalococcoidia bacterium]|nr:branched-chain amino acid ABC transporter permease [Dehalococcoidia bacterium]